MENQFEVLIYNAAGEKLLEEKISFEIAKAIATVLNSDLKLPFKGNKEQLNGEI
jgi:hypothetical protein